MGETREFIGSLGFGGNIRDYDVLEVLGKGGFATVHHGRCKTNDVHVAIKMIDKRLMTAKGMNERVIEEVKIHSRLKNPFIIELYAYFEDSNYVYLVLELCHNGGLENYLKRKRVLSEDEASCILYQVLEGLKYLHSHNIAHRDLSLSNVLFTKDMQVKIADFGLATQLSGPEDERFTICGTVNYMSPEVASHSSHGLPADVWGLGCMLYKMLVGKAPFDAGAMKSTLNRVVMAKYEIPSYLSFEAKDLITCLLKKDAKERLKLQDIMEHPFIKKEVHEQKFLVQDLSSDSGMGSVSTSIPSQKSVDSSYPSCHSFERNRSNDGIRSRSVDRSHIVNCNTECSRSSALGSMHSRNSPFITSSFLPNYPSDLSHVKCSDRAKSVSYCTNGNKITENRKGSNSYCGVHRHCEAPSRSTHITGHLHQSHSLNDLESPSCSCVISNSQICTTGKNCYHKDRHQLEASRENSHQSSKILKSCGVIDCTEGACTVHSFHSDGDRSCRTTRNIGPSYEQSVHCDNQLACQCSKCINASVCTTLQSCHISDRCGTSCRQSLHTDRIDEESEIHGPTPKPLNSERLKPMRQHAKNFVFTILESGEVCVEFLRKKGDRVMEVCRISPDGLKIVLYKTQGSHGVPIRDSPPDIPPEGPDGIYNFQTLPQNHWKKYVCAARYIDTVKAVTPKIHYYSEKAMCLLMENTPDPCFKMSFYEGGTVIKISAGVKLTDHKGNSVLLTGDMNVESLSSDMKLLWNHYLQCYQHCCKLDATLTRLNETMPDMVCFPIIIGSKPLRTQSGLGQGKENISSVVPPSSRNNTAATASSVVGYQISDSISAVKERVPHSQTMKTDTISFSVNIPNIGVATRLPSGEVQVSYSDKSSLLMCSSGKLKYIDDLGQEVPITKTALPAIVKKRLEEIPTVMNHIMAREQQGGKVRCIR